MNNNCRNKLTKMRASGSELNIRMADILIESELRFKTIVELSHALNTPLSSVSRFIRRLGYPSFPHFHEEYFSSDSNDQPTVNRCKENKMAIVDVIESMKNCEIIHIVTSRKDKAIGKFLNERLNEGFFANSLYHESSNDIKGYIKRVKKNDALFLIDLIGDSHIISLALQEIANIPNDEKPQIMVITAAKWLSIFERYKYIHVERLLDETLVQNATWKDYNFILKELLPVFIDILDSL